MLQVLERLVAASEENQTTEAIPLQPIAASNFYYSSGFGHSRSQTFPVSLRRGHLPHRHGLRTKIKCRHCSARGQDRRSKNSSGTSSSREEKSGIGGLVGKRITVHSTK